MRKVLIVSQYIIVRKKWEKWLTKTVGGAPSEVKKKCSPVNDLMIPQLDKSNLRSNSPPRLHSLPAEGLLICVRLRRRSFLWPITQHHKTIKLMGRWIAALPSRPAHNTVQLTGLLFLWESYDCTLSHRAMPFPLCWRNIQPYPLSSRHRTKLSNSKNEAKEAVATFL